MLTAKRMKKKNEAHAKRLLRMYEVNRRAESCHFANLAKQNANELNEKVTNKRTNERT